MPREGEFCEDAGTQREHAGRHKKNGWGQVHHLTYGSVVSSMPPSENPSILNTLTSTLPVTFLTVRSSVGAFCADRCGDNVGDLTCNLVSPDTIIGSYVDTGIVVLVFCLWSCQFKKKTGARMLQTLTKTKAETQVLNQSRRPPDPIKNVYSLPGKYLSMKYFTYTSVQIFKIIVRELYSKKIHKKSDPPHKTMLYCSL